MPNRPAHRLEDRFFLRVALLSRDRIAPPDEERAWPPAARIEASRARLRALVDDPLVREAIFLASAGLASEIERWREAPGSPRGRRIERALVGYVTRMATRATPFGAFAGVGVGRIGGRGGGSTSIAVGAAAEHRRRTRLGGAMLWQIVGRLEESAAARPRLRYHPNSSVFRVAGSVRYTEARPGPDGAIQYQMVSVEDTPLVAAALDRARGGRRLDHLARDLVGLGHATEEELGRFVGDLVDAQLLRSELSLALTGAGGLAELERALIAGGLADAAGSIAAIAEDLAAIDAAGLGASPARYAAARSRIDPLIGGGAASGRAGNWLHVDVGARVTGLLGREDADEIARAVEVLRALTRHPPHRRLDELRRAFEARWGEAEVPLPIAIDEDLGVGYGTPTAPQGGASPLLAGLPFRSAKEAPILAWEAREGWLMERFARAIAAGEREVVIEPAEASGAATTRPARLADACAVRARIAASGAILLEEIEGPSGARLLGRFCDVDPEVLALVRDHLAAEEALDPDAVFAELVYLGAARAADVVARPALRDTEIVYLGRGTAPVQLGLDDLLVSVRRGRVVLRSRQLDRRVMPRLTSSHHARGLGLPAYRFLAGLQDQDSAAVMWKWGAFNDAPFLPRLRVGRVVLARAGWKIDEREALELRAARGSDLAAFDAMRALAGRRGLPRHVVLSVFRQELFADLEDPLHAIALAATLAGRGGGRLLEAFPAADDLAARGPDGGHASEVVLLAVREPPAVEPAGPPAARIDDATEARAPRRFAPGSEWLYARLFAGASVLDRVLRLVIAPLAGAIEARGARWSFQRQADPDSHIALRVHGSPAWLLGDLLPALHRAAAPLLDDGGLWRVQLDTHEREVDRYGGDEAAGLMEEIGWRDSAAALAVIDAAGELDPETDADARWRLALAGSDRLLAALGLDPERRARVYSASREQLAGEQLADTALWRAIGARYRDQQPRIAELLAPDGSGDASVDDGDELAAGWAALEARDAALAGAAGRFAALLGDPLERPAALGAARDLVGLHCNRLFESAHGPHELVVVELLRRHHAHAARARTPQRR